MDSKEKKNNFSFDRYWKKQGRKDLFTWVHRYLRLHSELFVDSVYQNIYDYCRNTLIAYLKKDMDNKKINDEQLGGIIDVLTDIFNENQAERVNKQKSLVEELYKFFKAHPNAIKDIRI